MVIHINMDKVVNIIMEAIAKRLKKVSIQNESEEKITV